MALNILNNVYGSEIYKKKKYTMNVRISNNSKEFNLYQSNYHYEIGIIK